MRSSGSLCCATIKVAAVRPPSLLSACHLDRHATSHRRRAARAQPAVLRSVSRASSPRRGVPGRPGFNRILPYLRNRLNVLDLGCGNGRLLVVPGGTRLAGPLRGPGRRASPAGGSGGRPGSAVRASRPAFVLADLLREDWVDRVRADGTLRRGRSAWPSCTTSPLRQTASRSWRAAPRCCRPRPVRRLTPGSSWRPNDCEAAHAVGDDGYRR